MSNSTTYNRETAIREVLTPVEISSIDADERKCEICYDPFEEHFQETSSDSQNQVLLPPAKLPCGHTFGEECIIQWLQISASCPMCRAVTIPLPPEPSHDEIILEEWQQSRAFYINELMDNDREAATEALLFISQHTSPDEAPSGDMEFIVECIADEPELLTDTRHRAAQYYQRWQRTPDTVAEIDVLAHLIRQAPRERAIFPRIPLQQLIFQRQQQRALRAEQVLEQVGLRN